MAAAVVSLVSFPCHTSVTQVQFAPGRYHTMPRLPDIMLEDAALHPRRWASARVTAGASALHQAGESNSVNIPRMALTLGAAGTALAFLIAAGVSLYLFCALRRTKRRVKELEGLAQRAVVDPTASISHQPTTSLSLNYMVKSTHENVRRSRVCCFISLLANLFCLLSTACSALPCSCLHTCPQ